MHITLEVPSKTFTRVGLLVGVPLAILVGAQAVAWAVPLTPFVPKTPLTAQALNDSFTALSNAIDHPVITSKSGKTYSLGATYCGATSPQTGAIVAGSLTSYPAAKAQCEAASGCSLSAHMCTLEEMARSAQLGLLSQNNQQGFIASSFATYSTPALVEVTDCRGWTTATGYGGAWYFAPAVPNAGYPAIASCAGPSPIFCCDTEKP